MQTVRDFLRSVWAEPGVPDPPRRVWRDWVLIAVFLPATLLEGLLRDDLPWRALSTAVAMALVVTLLWRRTHPLAMVAIAFGTVGAIEIVRVAMGVDPPGLGTQAYMVLLPYSLFRWGSGRQWVIGLAIMLVPACTSLLFDATSIGEAIGGLAVFFSLMAIGAAVRYKGRARERELEQVRMRERETLARDLHDTVAHHVSAIVIRAQAGLATSSTHPGGAVEALQVIETEAARTLNEMRTMVRVLRRDEPAARSPTPRICDIATLAQAGDTGPPVQLEITGAVDDVSEPVSTAVYRLVQESITNARRHARNATHIDVRVGADATMVRLHVHDDGETPPGRSVAAPGYGITGMIERAGLLGGHCTAGPDGHRGWTVAAVLPRNGVGR